MKNINKVILVGHIGCAPVQRYTKSGVSVVHFPVATSRKRYKQEPNGVENQIQETQWHQVVVWGSKQGDACIKYLKKGSLVFIEGFLKTRYYETKLGSQKLSVEVHTENISFLTEKNNISLPERKSSSSEMSACLSLE